MPAAAAAMPRGGDGGRAGGAAGLIDGGLGGRAGHGGEGADEGHCFGSELLVPLVPRSRFLWANPKLINS